jgi:hypothetical protein
MGVVEYLGMMALVLLLWRIAYLLSNVLKEMQYRNELLGHQCRWLEETVGRLCGMHSCKCKNKSNEKKG